MFFHVKIFTLILDKWLGIDNKTDEMSKGGCSALRSENSRKSMKAFFRH